MAADAGSHYVSAVYALDGGTGRPAQEREEPPTPSKEKETRRSIGNEWRGGWRVEQRGEPVELSVQSCRGDSQRDYHSVGQSGRSVLQRGRSSRDPLSATEGESGLVTTRSWGGASVKEIVQWNLEGGEQEARLWSPVGSRPTRSPEGNRRSEEPESGGKLGWVTEDQRYVPYVPEGPP